MLGCVCTACLPVISRWQFVSHPVAVLQHEILLEQCGFNSIAIAQAPEGYGATRSGATDSTEKEKIKRRWLIFVDKRRGLLGRKLLACRTRADPPPGRRRSYQTGTPLPASTTVSGTSILDWQTTSLTGAPELPSGHSSRHAARVATAQLKTLQHPDLHLGFKVPSDDDDNRSRRRRTLPILKGNRSAQEDNNKVEGRSLEDDTITSGLDVEGSTLKPPEREGLDDDKLNMGRARLVAHSSGAALSKISGVSKETKGGFSHQDAAAAAAALPEAQSREGCIDEDEEKQRAVEILLRGLNRPSLVAAAASGKGGGVFFIDCTPPAATVKSNTRTLDKTTRGEKINGTLAFNCVNCPTAAQTWQLRFLRWGAGQAITLVNYLCNPIGLCIRSSDLSVFVLEQVWPRRQRNNDHGQDRHRGGSKRCLNRKQKRYRVCRLDGARLSAWLANEAKRNSAGSEPCMNNRPERGTMTQRVAQESGAMTSSADRTSCSDDDQSETDWDNSSGTSDDGCFDRHVVQDLPVSSSGAPSKKCSSYRSARSRRGQACVGFVEVLDLLAPSTDQQDDNRHPEKPVDLCVLTDGTIVLAFARPAPLHDGASVTQNQSVIRAFPTADRNNRTERSTDVASSTDNLVKIPVVASGPGYNVDDPLVYNFNDSWLVAEGLPVVTGLAAGGGGAVYVSFRGARHDGIVTAIGSLPTSRPRCRLLVDTRRDKFRVGAARASPTGGASSSGRNHADASEKNGGGGAHSGGNLVRIASGFASALTVDDDMNL